jgi:hypothetical protein
MEQSPTKSPQKKICRASSESLYSELPTEIEIMQERQNQVGIINEIQYVFMIFLYCHKGKRHPCPLPYFQNCNRRICAES